MHSKSSEVKSTVDRKKKKPIKGVIPKHDKKAVVTKKDMPHSLSSGSKAYDKQSQENQKGHSGSPVKSNKRGSRNLTKYLDNLPKPQNSENPFNAMNTGTPEKTTTGKAHGLKR